MKRKKRLTGKRPIYVCLGILGIVCAGISLLLFAQVAAYAPIATVEQKKATIYPTQYSDKHITENAKATDERLNTLAKIKKESFLASAASSLTATTPALETSQPEKGTWLWTPTLGLTPAYRDSVIAGAKRDGIRNFYLSLDSYLDIFVLPDGPEKIAKKKAFDNALDGFITAAHKNTMTVDAEGGWRNWAEPGNEYKSSAIIDYVL